MKVVLFCGGFGMRLKENSESIPKPMVKIGYRPILWQIMRYYAHYGHKDFILCLGYKADEIKKYFMNYDETVSNNFIMTEGGKKVILLKSDIHDWGITFIDTGLRSNVGQRLVAIKKYLKDDEVFLANYTDGLSDLPLPKMIDFFKKHNKIACFIGVKPNQSFHLAQVKKRGVVKNFSYIQNVGMSMNGGYFIFKNQIFDFIRKGEDLLEEPFKRLIAKDQLITYKYDGFWTCMDTFKEKQLLEDMYTRGKTPWEVWKNSKNENDQIRYTEKE
ncbi:MAG: sugar phosphate nucleotidyltransferase [Thermodesulfobacteriota bacterium]